MDDEEVLSAASDPVAQRGVVTRARAAGGATTHTAAEPAPVVRASTKPLSFVAKPPTLAPVAHSSTAARTASSADSGQGSGPPIISVPSFPAGEDSKERAQAFLEKAWPMAQLLLPLHDPGGTKLRTLLLDMKRASQVAGAVSSHANINYHVEPGPRAVHTFTNQSLATGISVRVGGECVLPGTVLPDPCSGGTLVNRTLADRLHLPRIPVDMTFQQSGGSKMRLTEGVRLELVCAAGTGHSTATVLEAALVDNTGYDILLGNDANWAWGARLDSLERTYFFRPDMRHNPDYMVGLPLSGGPNIHLPVHVSHLTDEVTEITPSFACCVDSDSDSDSGHGGAGGAPPVQPGEQPSGGPNAAAVSAASCKCSEPSAGSVPTAGVAVPQPQRQQAGAPRVEEKRGAAPAGMGDSSLPADALGTGWYYHSFFSRPKQRPKQQQPTARTRKHDATRAGAERRRQARAEKARKQEEEAGGSPMDPDDLGGMVLGGALGQHMQIISAVTLTCIFAAMSLLWLPAHMLVPTQGLGTTAQCVAIATAANMSYTLDTSSWRSLVTHSAASLSYTLDPPALDRLSAPQFYLHESGHKLGHALETNPAHKERILQILSDNRNTFAWEPDDLPGYKGPMPPFTIKLHNQKPQVQGRRRYSGVETDYMRSKTAELLKFDAVGKVRPDQSVKHIANITLPAKKAPDGTWTDRRMCYDYRMLNAASETDHYGLHRPDELLQRVSGKAWHCSLDARSGYMQLHVAEEDQLKTCFRVDNELYYFKRLPFGLKNAPAYFQRTMDMEIARAGLEGCVACYVDDLICFGDTFEEMAEALERTLDMCSRIGLKIHPEKSVFGVQWAEFLGHRVGLHGMTPQEAKVAAIKQLPVPTNVSELRSTLGLMSYYRCYCPDFSGIAAPLYHLTSKHVAWSWTPECQVAFERLRDWLCTPGLVLRPLDPDRPLILHTDWSKLGYGAVLGQKDDDGNEYMVACASRSCNIHEKNYIPYMGECKAVVWALHVMRPYVHGRHITVVTDHLALKWLLQNPTPTGQMARMSVALQEYDLLIEHRPGDKNQNADALSRLPRSDTTDHDDLGPASGMVASAAAIPMCPAHALTQSPVCVQHFRQHTHADLPTDIILSHSAIDEFAPRHHEFCAVDDTDTSSSLGGEGEPAGSAGETGSSFAESYHTAVAAELYDGPRDIWDDEGCMHYVKSGACPPGSSETECKRILRRSKVYSWADGKLHRALPDNTRVECPHASRRLQLIKEWHERTGHFGINRTAHMLRQNFWWAGLQSDVTKVVRQCGVCDRAAALVNQVHPHLQPLPIRMLCYRWGCDLFGPLPTTASGDRYVMVCVEHFSKHIECIPIPNKHAATCARVFEHHVLGRFGAPAEVVTDGGGEWEAEFQALCERWYIDHRVTSPDHPQANGLSERCVQSIKKCLRKYCDLSVDKTRWDEALPMICLAYRCSPQASTRYSPARLLYGRDMVIPPAIAERIMEPVSFDDPELASTSLLLRAEWIQHHQPMATANALIAQHRDTLHYARKRGGGYTPRLRRFQLGDYVYEAGDPATTLDMAVNRAIYRIVELHDSGVATLMGRCGRTTKNNIKNLAPCHLLVEEVVDHTLARPPADYPCSICNSAGDDARMLLCDGCGKGYHTFCLKPPLQHVPEGDWLCHVCVKDGISMDLVTERRKRMRALMAAQPPPLPGQVRANAEHAGTEFKRRQWDGRLVIRPADSTHPRSTWGVVRYKGDAAGPKCFDLHFSDGTVLRDQTVSILTRNKWMQPVGTEWPADVPRPVESYATSPLTAGTTTAEDMLINLRRWMPGSWQRHQAVKLMTDINPPFARVGTSCRVATCHVETLLSRVRLGQCGTVLDPFAYGGGPAVALERALGASSVLRGSDCATLGGADHMRHTYLDPLNVDALGTACDKGKCGAIVTVPPTPVLDIFVPMAASVVTGVLAVHVPTTYVMAAHTARDNWLVKMREAGRLLYIFLGPALMWVVVFASADTKAALTCVKAPEARGAHAQVRLGSSALARSSLA